MLGRLGLIAITTVSVRCRLCEINAFVTLDVVAVKARNGVLVSMNDNVGIATQSETDHPCKEG